MYAIISGTSINRTINKLEIAGVDSIEFHKEECISVQIPANFMSDIVFPIAAFVDNSRINPECSSDNECFDKA